MNAEILARNKCYQYEDELKREIDKSGDRQKGKIRLTACSEPFWTLLPTCLEDLLRNQDDTELRGERACLRGALSAFFDPPIPEETDPWTFWWVSPPKAHFCMIMMVIGGHSRGRGRRESKED